MTTTIGYGVPDNTMESNGGRDHQASRLITIASEARLFKTPEGEGYAQLEVNGHWETYPLSARAVKDWLIIRYMETYGGTPNKTALENALGFLQANARFRGETHEVHVRLAWYEDALYLDLCNENREVVRVTQEDWEIITDAPVYFRRPPSMKALPTPKNGGTLEQLRRFLNLPTDTDREWTLVVAWLLGSLHPTGPYPILGLHGEKGSAKSTATRYLRQIIDPTAAPAPIQARDSADLTLKAHNNWVVAFDNMSSMPRWLSDGLCRLSTGAGDSKRELYANTEEVVFKAKRPCIINGIEELATAGDLLDRTIIVTLPVIYDERRTSEAEMDAAFAEAWPYILGALLDAVSAALFKRDSVKLTSKPRMADFALWVTAAETFIGWQPGAFMNAYAGNRADATRLEIEASPVANAVCRLMEKRSVWTGTATDLLKELRLLAEEGATYHYSWPKNARALSGTLTRVAGALRSQGIVVSKDKSGSRSVIIQQVAAVDATDASHSEDHSKQPLKWGMDAKDAKLPLNPTSISKEKKEEREVGTADKIASGASGAPDPFDADWEIA